ncbi:hypothetical protein, partial [Burkholderia glumae]|uniref:hypothetical protein n=1 Tax=Burkholderia glumae TaxID=337 RepID=UPI0020CE97A7
ASGRTAPGRRRPRREPGAHEARRAPASGWPRAAGPEFAGQTAVHPVPIRGGLVLPSARFDPLRRGRQAV